MIAYHLSYTSALSHYLDISITITGNSQQELYLQLPAWRPGRYELQNFAQKLRQVTATAHGESIAFEKGKRKGDPKNSGWQKTKKKSNKR